MTSRRDFIRIGMAATTLPLAAAAAGAATTGRESRVPLYAVVYDSRFRAGRAFASRAGQLGLRTLGIEGDMTSAWYHDLYHRWKRGAAAIAGMTEAGALFCFEQLARDQRMRVVFRAEHRATDSGVTHSMTGPATMLSAALEPGREPDRIGRTMADVVAACPNGRCELAATEVSQRSILEPGNQAVALYSWVIAPAIPS